MKTINLGKYIVRWLFTKSQKPTFNDRSVVFPLEIDNERRMALSIT